MGVLVGEGIRGARQPEPLREPLPCPRSVQLVVADDRMQRLPERAGRLAEPAPFRPGVPLDHVSGVDQELHVGVAHGGQDPGEEAGPVVVAVPGEAERPGKTVPRPEEDDENGAENGEKTRLALHAASLSSGYLWRTHRTAASPATANDASAAGVEVISASTPISRLPTRIIPSMNET